MAQKRLDTTLALAVLALAAMGGGCSKRRFRIPSESMFPALASGESFLVDTGAKSPAPGEVWVFHFPENPTQEFVKRIVAGPGDHIEERGGRLFLNGEPLPTCVLGAYRATLEGTSVAGRLVLEKSKAGFYLAFHDDRGPGVNGGPWDVQPGEFFAVGDNRKNSHDSRTWNAGRGGGVPQSLLIGRAEIPPVVLPAGAGDLEAALSACKTKLGAP